MLAVWAITSVPDTRNGGANGGGSSSCISSPSARAPPPCAGRLAGHVDVLGARFLERQAHELATPLDARPIVQLVDHPPSLRASPSTR